MKREHRNALQRARRNLATEYHRMSDVLVDPDLTDEVWPTADRVFHLLDRAICTINRLLGTGTKDPQEEEHHIRLDGPMHSWFSLSYSSFLVLPRSLIQEMPTDWQKQMVQLLEEMNERFPNQPDIAWRVRVAKPLNETITYWELEYEEVLVDPPDWACYYRRPDMETINSFREPAA